MGILADTNYSHPTMDGRSGLLRSIEKFDVDKGFRFSTYTTIWIKAVVLKFISKRCAPVHVLPLAIVWNVCLWNVFVNILTLHWTEAE
ncbi:hypothetical protein O6H91_16G078900 [Diphasiastrum complanatum]|uniref:Uncharacterized protein n=1 Tax=Diphasiastrum complanatum TaxID=34168 RepID=A0ACC2BDZ5_DIPCM|nr:hypothetical protein O6H91_16G078900 [Diphasiastrum complanatum]